MITYSDDGGDLGRASIRPITAIEMQIIIPHVANVLEELAVMKLSELPFKYAFELPVIQRHAAQFVMETSIKDLPPHVYWYEIDGRRLFEIRGQSGGVTTAVICYLITKVTMRDIKDGY